MISLAKWTHPTKWYPVSNFLQADRQINEPKRFLSYAAMLNWFRPWILRVDDVIPLCEKVADGAMESSDFSDRLSAIMNDADRPFYAPNREFFAPEQLGNRALRRLTYETPIVQFSHRILLRDASLPNVMLHCQRAWNFVPRNLKDPLAPEIESRLTNLLRELFTREIKTVPPEWKREEVVDLARTIDAGKRFDLMPILGDLLADAGCTDREMLDHARQPVEGHVKGCWLIELLQSFNMRT